MSRIRTESVGDSLCPVCHENSEIFAIGPCDHPICYRCSTRMRVLCSQMYCPICRGDLPQIVFLTTKRKYDQVQRRSCIPNRRFKILLEDESVEDAFEALLEHHCQVCDTRPMFDSFQMLQTHMNRTHTLFACDLCVNHLKIFPFERKFYNRKDLATHRRTGDADNRSYRGHPLCRFCDVRYMDNDELLRHLRKSHYFCHFCDASSNNNEYFDDYPDLKEHFRTQHFLCSEGQCGLPETRFTNAFATEIDFKAHVASDHMGNKSKAQARELRTIDVSFQVAPRRRGRDTGVIAPEDFEEVNESSRGPRDRRPRRNNQHRYEAPARNEDVTPPSEASAPTPPQPPVLDDFPTLGNCPPPYTPAPVQKPSEVAEDFPSLSSNKQSRSDAATCSSLVPASVRPGKSSVSGVSQKQAGNFSVTASSVTSSSVTSRPASAQSRPVETNPPVRPSTGATKAWRAPQLASGEDFPSLGGDRKRDTLKDGPNLVTLGAWTNKQKNNSRPLSGRGDREARLYNSVPSLAAVGQSLCDDGEFPSLGGDTAPKKASWVSKTGKQPVKAVKSTPLGNCLDAASSTSKKTKRDEVVQLNGSSETGTDHSVSKKKKKKPKEKGQETKTNTENSGISLSSIAREIDSLAVISEQSSVKEDCSGLNSCQDVPSPGQTGPSVPVADSEPSESGGWETVTNRKSVGFHEDDFPSLSALPKKSIGKPLPGESAAENSSARKSQSVVKDTSKTFQDDYPALSAVSSKKAVPSSSARETTCENGSVSRHDQKKKPGSLVEEDFPKLEAERKKTRPPPGFGKAQVAGPPPGLCAPPSSGEGRTPPGLNSTSSMSTSSSSSSPVSIPMSVKLQMYLYVLPQDTKERNSSLVTRVRQLLILKDGGFDQFRALSAEFRSGQMNARTYHKTCGDLFGQERFLEVLPELVALLPDILKQHELAEAHRQSILGICAPMNLTTCPTCHQYLRVEDWPVHFGTHANLGQDLPAAGLAASALPLKT